MTRPSAGAAFDDPMAKPVSVIAGIFLKRVSLCCATLALFLAAGRLHADQVEMQNGDRYLGNVLSLDTNTLVLRSDVLGTVRLARSKVAHVTFGSNATANIARMTPATNGPPGASFGALSNGVTDLSAPLRQLGANTNFIQQVQAQLLGDAGPEANKKFNEMVAGMMSGKLTVNDIRVEAKSAADQLKELKRDLGDDAGGALDGYLAILENFLRETAPPGVSSTNVSPPSARTKPATAGVGK